MCVSGQQATDSKYLARVRNDGWEKVVFKSGAFGLCVVNWDQEIHANEKYHVWGLTLYNNMLPPSNHRNKERILPKSIGFFSAWLIWPVHCTRTWDAAPHHQGYDIIVRGSLFIYIHIINVTGGESRTRTTCSWCLPLKHRTSTLRSNNWTELSHAPTLWPQTYFIT